MCIRDRRWRGGSSGAGGGAGGGVGGGPRCRGRQDAGPRCARWGSGLPRPRGRSRRVRAPAGPGLGSGCARTPRRGRAALRPGERASALTPARSSHGRRSIARPARRAAHVFEHDAAWPLDRVAGAPRREPSKIAHTDAPRCSGPPEQAFRGARERGSRQRFRVPVPDANEPAARSCDRLAAPTSGSSSVVVSPSCSDRGCGRRCCGR